MTRAFRCLRPSLKKLLCSFLKNPTSIFWGYFAFMIIESLPGSNPASEISCVICWTDFSSFKGVLSYIYCFCFKCIHRRADEIVSKNKKEPTCPLCLKSFDFITVTNDALKDFKVSFYYHFCTR